MKFRIALGALVFSASLLTACSKPAGLGTATDDFAPMLEDGAYVIDTEASMLYWEGYKPVGGHRGGISLQKGEFSVLGGRPDQGSFVLDMNSITDEDLSEDMQSGLVNHLKSDDFFSVADYPTSRFDITRITPYSGDANYNYKVEGDLSIRDITKPVTVLAIIAGKGDTITAKGRAMINRTDFDITIRSGSFFEELGDRLIKDEFLLEMDLVATK